MTHQEITAKLGKLVKEERRITEELLKTLQLAMEKKTYLEEGYPTLFAWLTKGFGYAEASAYRRIEAAKLLKANPEVAKKLQAGEVNLTTLSKAQTIFRAEERVREVSPEEKKEALKDIESKSTEEAERALLKRFPGAGSKVKNERKKVLDENTTRHSMNFDAEISADLKRAKEVLFHIIPSGLDAQIIGYALKFLLQKKDPMQWKKPRKKARSKAA